MSRALFVLLLAGLVGCDLLSITGRNVAVFFSTPARVANKTTNPGSARARLAVLWVGHATMLVQLDDRFVLTDPVFTRTVGQITRRLVEPGIRPEHVPPLDAVLISHLHPDHLSLGSLDTLEAKTKRLIVPTGGIAYIPDYAFRVHELATWETKDVGGLRITAVPVDHTGFRYGVDGAWMTKAFTGYVLEYRGVTVYFGGDTAYDAAHFAATRKRFPTIDLAILPIGPIRPRAVMKGVHVDPEEAVQAFLDLGAKVMLPMHYGTFASGAEDTAETLALLDAAAKKKQLPPGALAVLAIGEERVFVARASP